MADTKHAPEEMYGLPWRLCNDGECPCLMIHSADDMVATVVSGKWGDDFPVIRLVSGTPGSCAGELTLKAEMNQMTYGEVDPAIAKERALLIIRATNSHHTLVEACKLVMSSPGASDLRGDGSLNITLLPEVIIKLRTVLALDEKQREVAAQVNAGMEAMGFQHIGEDDVPDAKQATALHEYDAMTPEPINPYSLLTPEQKADLKARFAKAAGKILSEDAPAEPTFTLMPLYEKLEAAVRRIDTWTYPRVSDILAAINKARGERK